MGRITRRVGYSIIAVTMFAALLRGPSAVASPVGQVPTGDLDASSIGRLLGVDAEAANDGWAVGDVTVDGVSSTLIKHWDGVSWQHVASPSPGGSHGSTLAGVTALAPDDAWAVGSYGTPATGDRTLILHWDGVTWTQVSSPNPSALADNSLQGVAAVSADDVWAVGNYASFGLPAATMTLHWDGLSWSVVPSPNPSHHIFNAFNAVSALATNDVWAAGSYRPSAITRSTLVAHWNGKRWSRPATPNPGVLSNQLSGISAVSAKLVWAVGDSTTVPTQAHALIERWNGRKWAVVAGPDLGGAVSGLNAVSASSRKNAWAVGYVMSDGVSHTLTAHWNGSTWAQVGSPSPGAFGNTLHGTVATGRDSAWAVGTALSTPLTADPLIAGWNGVDWQTF